MVLVEVAHAVTMGRLGPLQPKRMAILPAAMLEIIMGTNSGEMRDAPRLSSLSHSVMSVLMPPMPLPTYTPKRSGSMLPAMPLSDTACIAAATAYWVNRSIRRASPREMPKRSGSKSFTSAATEIFVSE